MVPDVTMKIAIIAFEKKLVHYQMGSCFIEDQDERQLPWKWGLELVLNFWYVRMIQPASCALLFQQQTAVCIYVDWHSWKLFEYSYKKISEKINFFRTNLPAANRVPLADPNVDITTVSDINQATAPKTRFPKVWVNIHYNYLVKKISSITYSNHQLDSRVIVGRKDYAEELWIRSDLESQCLKFTIVCTRRREKSRDYPECMCTHDGGDPSSESSISR